MDSSPLHVVNSHRRRELLARRWWWSRGAISIGADQSSIAPTVLNNNGDTSAGLGWTTAVSSQAAGVGVPLIQRTNNDFYPYIAGVLAVRIGAGAPGTMQVAYALVAGTPISTVDIPVAALVATTTVMIPFVLKGPLSQSAYAGAGAIPLVQVNTTTNLVTVLQLGSSAVFQLLPGVE